MIRVTCLSFEIVGSAIPVSGIGEDGHLKFGIQIDLEFYQTGDKIGPYPCSIFLLLRDFITVFLSSVGG